MKFRQYSFDITDVALVLSNLIPIYGVLFLEWDTYKIVLLYWAESGVIGFYTILKLTIVCSLKAKWKILERLKWTVALVLFFCVHFGMFMLVHLLGIVHIFGEQAWGFSFSDIATILLIVLPALASLFLTHGISFLINFLFRGEYKTAEIATTLFSPYPRIIIMHMVIIVSGFFTILFNNNIIMLVLLCVFKILVDLNSHVRSHTPKLENASLVIKH